MDLKTKQIFDPEQSTSMPLIVNPQKPRSKSRGYSSIDEDPPKDIMFSFDAINSSEVIEIITETGLITPETNRFKGIVAIMLATICFTLTVVFCKLAYQNNPNLNGLDYILLRASSMALMSVLQVGYLKLNIFDIKQGYRRMMLIRCMIGGTGMPAFFIGLKYIPSSKASLIFNISPILVAVFAYFLLNEQITKLKIFAVVGAFTGVVLFSYSKNDSNEEMTNYYIGIILVSVSCMCGTIIALLLRVINQHVHYAMSPFWFSITTLSEALLVLIFIPSLYNFSNYTLFDCSCFLISGVFNYMGQTLSSIALKYEDASVVTPFGYFQTLYLFICDLVIFHYSFTFTDITGAILITICLLAPIFQRVYEHRISK